MISQLHSTMKLVRLLEVRSLIEFRKHYLLHHQPYYHCLGFLDHCHCHQQTLSPSLNARIPKYIISNIKSRLFNLLPQVLLNHISINILYEQFIIQFIIRLPISSLRAVEQPLSLELILLPLVPTFSCTCSIRTFPLSSIITSIKFLPLAALPGEPHITHIGSLSICFT